MADAHGICPGCGAELAGAVRTCSRCGSNGPDATPTFKELGAAARSAQAPTRRDGPMFAPTSPAPLAPARLLAPGTRLGSVYTIESLIAEGGMGVVYRALDSA